MAQHAATISKRARLRIKLFGEILNELKKVVWLTRREVIYLTFLVIVVAFTMGLVLGGFDFGFARLIEDVFVGR